MFPLGSALPTAGSRPYRRMIVPDSRNRVRNLGTAWGECFGLSRDRVQRGLTCVRILPLHLQLCLHDPLRSLRPFDSRWAAPGRRSFRRWHGECSSNCKQVGRVDQKRRFGMARSPTAFTFGLLLLVPAGWPTAAAKGSGTVFAADESEITIDEVGPRRQSTARWEWASGRSRRRWQ
jgi:hypothetical protein